MSEPTREELLAAIRRHRDYRGDDRCHLDDGELYSVLPEGDTRPKSDLAVTIENCTRFIMARQLGREYVSPNRVIAELEAEVGRLREAFSRHEHELQGTLGGKLYGTDPETKLPRWGDHVAETLAIEAVRRIDHLEAGIDSVLGAIEKFQGDDEALVIAARETLKNVRRGLGPAGA